MIKCIGFGRSLKQLLIIGLISCFILLGNSFASAENGYFGSAGDLFTTSNYNNNYSMTTSEYGNLFSQYGGNTKQLFMPGKGNFIYWSSDGVPYIYYSSYINDYAGSSASTYQGYATKYFICDTSDLISFQAGNNNSLYSLSCSSNNILSDSVSYFSNFLGTYKNTDTYYYYRRQTGCNGNSMWEFFVCLNSSELGQSLCFGDVSRDCAWWYGSDTNYYGGISNTGDVFDSNRNNVSFDSIDSSLLKLSPYSPGSSNNNINVDYSDGLSNYNYTTFTGSDLVSYYENNPNYRFNENICYIGTDDLTSLYEDGIPYYDGEGKTIFELYSHLYGQNSNTSLSEVGKFMNAWWINYATWFEGRNRNSVDDSVIYNANYSPGSGFYLTYNNLTNPFVGNLSAIYFMASNITSYTLTMESQGDQVALYCYYKLGSENNSWVVEGDEFQPYWNNVGNYTTQQRRNTGYFSGSSSIISQSWNNTPLSYFSGVNNLEFTSFFSDSFNRFSDVFTEIDLDNITSVGVLPTYIILFLLAVILFKFLRK